MKRIYLIIIILLFLSCKNNYNIVGDYRFKIDINQVPESNIISIKPDSTFYYLSSGGWIKESSQGKWNVNKEGFIMLESYLSKIDSIPIFIEEKADTCSQFKLFIFNKIDFKFKPLKWNLIINGNKFYPIEKDSVFIIDRIKINTISIVGYIDIPKEDMIVPIPMNDTIKTITYSINNINNSIFIIGFPSYFNNNLIYFVPIKETLKIRKNALFRIIEGRKLRYDKCKSGNESNQEFSK